MSSRSFPKNKKSYKKIFKILKRKKTHILERLEQSIKDKNLKSFNSLIKSVEDKGLKNSVEKITQAKNKLKL